MKTIPITPEHNLPTTCSSSELFALQILDDSMAPEFNPGHIVVIDSAARLVAGAYVLIRCVEKRAENVKAELDPGWIIRRWCPVNEQQVILETLSSDWVNEQVNSCDVEIHGVVVQRAGRRRSERRHYR